MFGERTYEEPFGHAGDATKIERFLTSTRGEPLALRRERTERFDPHAVMTFAPMQYIGSPWTLEPSAPSDEWVAEALQAFVRSEFPDRARPTKGPISAPDFQAAQYLSDDFLNSFLSASEESLSIEVRSGSSSASEMAANVYELLCDKRIGSSRNRSNNPEQNVIDFLSPVIDSRSRLLFILPGFPFKDQNRFRVPFAASQPDLADLSFMIRLHRLTQAIYQIHPFGADVLVLTDGSLYAQIFDVSLDEANLYARRMLSYRNQLNLQGTVSFFPLLDLIERTTDGGAVFWHIVDHLELTIAELRRANLLVGTFASLAFGMRRNMQTRDRLKQLESSEAWDVVWGDNALDPSHPNGALRMEIDRLTERATLRYASINLALRWTRVIERSFPGALRGTVHPKPGQFALAGTGGAYAWNGVAFSRRLPPHTIDDVSVRSISDIGHDGSLKPFLFRDGLPAFFAEAPA